ncbi:MAG: hypothetical protein H7287_00560 [Thermoleophilia bacterium]|nr:hypothetical protein [Thermoleophilia bacterium]
MTRAPGVRAVLEFPGGNMSVANSVTIAASRLSLITATTRLAETAYVARIVGERPAAGAGASVFGVAAKPEKLLAERVASIADLKDLLRSVIRHPDRPEGLKQALKGIHTRIVATERQGERAALLGDHDAVGFGQLLVTHADDALAALKRFQ